MAGKGLRSEFVEKLSPFLKSKLEEISKQRGVECPEYRALLRQYAYASDESLRTSEDNTRHWEADLAIEGSNGLLKGLERLYRRSVVIEPTMICAAHCRYCLRANYHVFTLTEAELLAIARYCGSPELREDVREVLITGGDPLMVPHRLKFLLEALVEHAPNVRVFRVGTRLFSQDPGRIDVNLFESFRNIPGIRMEIATQINHPVELFPEAVEKIETLTAMGIKIYAQNVILRGVNDDVGVLAEIYDLMRIHNIEPHYLFHCVPMKGMAHLRTSVARGLELATELVNSGRVSGRAKPAYAAMTDIGKILLYDGSIIRSDAPSRRLLLQSTYRLDERRKYNQTWALPKTAEVDDSGRLRVWYLDGGSA